MMKPLSAENSVPSAGPGLFPLRELQNSFIIYCTCQYFKRGSISLPCACYTASSMLENYSLQNGAASDVFIQSHEEMDALLATIRDQICRLTALYSSEVFKNMYLVHWVSARVNAQYQAVTLQQLAQELHINKVYLCGVISSNTGCTFRDLVFCRRLFAFTELVLECPGDTLEALCIRLGYNSIHHFSKIVKKHTGICPSILRRTLLLIHARVTLPDHPPNQFHCR